MSEFIFGSIEERLQGFAKFLFYFLLVVGIGAIIIGFFKVQGVASKYSDTFAEVMYYTAEDAAYGMAKDYDWYVDGYKGKMLMTNGFYAAISSITTLPLYAFGVLIEEVKAMKYHLKKISEKE